MDCYHSECCKGPLCMLTKNGQYDIFLDFIFPFSPLPHSSCVCLFPGFFSVLFSFEILVFWPFCIFLYLVVWPFYIFLLWDCSCLAIRNFSRCSVQLLSHVQLCDPMNCSTPGFPVHTPTSGACSNSCPSSRWCHPTISSSVIPFSSHLQPFPASVSFPMNQFFASGGQSVGASASILPMSIQDWFPLRLTGLISLQSKGLSRVFSNTTVQKHHFTSLCCPMKYTLSRWHSW